MTEVLIPSGAIMPTKPSDIINALEGNVSYLMGAIHWLSTPDPSRWSRLYSGLEKLDHSDKQFLFCCYFFKSKEFSSDTKFELSPGVVKWLRSEFPDR
jgi:hypothetical protein